MILICSVGVSAVTTIDTTDATWTGPDESVSIGEWIEIGAIAAKANVSVVSFDVNYRFDNLYGECNLIDSDAGDVIHTGTWVSGTCLFTPAVQITEGIDYYYLNAKTIHSLLPQSLDPITVPIERTNINFSSFEPIGGLESVTSLTGGVYVCPETDNSSVVYYMKDENNPDDYLLGDFEIEIIEPTTNSAVFNGEQLNSTNISICIAPATANYTYDIYLKYTADDGFTHSYYTFDTLLDNVSQSIDVYNFNTTTGVTGIKITARDLFTYKVKPNILGKLQRRYVSEGTWRTVQMSLSGGFGAQLFNIIEDTTDYRIIFTDTDNCVLDTTDSMKLSCGTCDFEKVVEDCSSSTISADLNIGISYDNTTKIVNVIWNDPLGVTTVLNSIVSKETPTGNLTICDNTTSSSSGSHNCDITGHVGLVLVRVVATQNGQEVLVDSKWIDARVGLLSNLISKGESALWTFGIVLTCIMFGMFSPVGAIIGMMVGLVAVFYLGIMSAVTITFIALAAVIGVAIGIKLKR